MKEGRPRRISTHREDLHPGGTSPRVAGWILGFLVLGALAGCFPPQETVRRSRPDGDPPIVTYPKNPRRPHRVPPARILPARRLPVESFKAFLALPDEKMDYGVGAVLFARRNRPGLKGQALLAFIDGAASKVRSRLGASASGFRILKEINNLLFHELDFRFDHKDPEGIRPENLYLDTVVQRRRGYCVSLSLLYLAVAQRLGLPVFGVRVPGHFIVRYQKGGDIRNVETTDFGLALPNSHYIRKYKISSKSLKKGVYMSNLSPRQVFVDLMNNRGTLLGLSGRAQAAIEEFDWALETDPLAASVFYNRGVMKMRLHRFDQALKDFKRCLDLDENSHHAMTNMAEVYTVKRDFRKGLEIINRVINMAPGYSNGYLQRGLILHRMGKKSLAEQNIDRALELDERNSNAYLYRARIRREEGELMKAVLDLNSACGISPKESICFAERALTYFQLNRWEKALADFNEAVRLDPEVAEYYLNRGLAFLKKGQRRNAAQDFEKAIALAPHNPQTYAKRAALEILDRNFKGALPYLDSALVADRDHVPSLLSRGSVYLHLGRTREAVADLTRAVHLAPGQADAYRQLGKAYADSGRKEKAIFFLRKYVSLAGSGSRREAVTLLKRLESE